MTKCPNICASKAIKSMFRNNIMNAFLAPSAPYSSAPVQYFWTSPLVVIERQCASNASHCTPLFKQAIKFVPNSKVVPVVNLEFPLLRLSGQSQRFENSVWPWLFALSNDSTPGTPNRKGNSKNEHWKMALLCPVGVIKSRFRLILEYAPLTVCADRKTLPALSL